MSEWRDEVRRRIEPLALTPAREAEIIEEVGQHLEDRYRELCAHGHAPGDAAAIARRELEEGDALARNVAGVERRPPVEVPPAGAPARGRGVAALWQDVRYAARGLARAPGFTLTVLFAMSLSIGPTTAILSIGNWLLWRPHPGVADSSRLAEVWVGRWVSANGVSPTWLTYEDLAHIAERSQTMAGIAGGQELSASLSVHGQLPRVVGTAHVTANFFDVLGVRLRAGRTFVSGDDRDSAPPVAIVRDGLAQASFGGPDAALGKSISLNSRPFTIIGVVDPDFDGTSTMAPVDVWIPGTAYDYLNHWADPGPPVFYSFVVRLTPGIEAAAAQRELNGMIQALAAGAGDGRRLKGASARVFAGLGVHPLMRERTGKSVRAMLLIGGVLLLIGCANVANLLVLRATRRSHEMRVRRALGASGRRLVQMHLTEAVLLAVGGAALGLALAALLKELMQALMFPEARGAAVVVPLDGRVLAATTATAITAGLLAAVAPAWVAARGAVLRSGSAAGMRTSTRPSFLRGALAAVQLALSLTLLVGALLLVTTLRNLRAIELGFNPAGLTVLDVDLGSHGYEPERQLLYLRTVLSALASHGQFEGVTVAERAPFGPGMQAKIDTPEGTEPIVVGTNGVSANYFEVLRTPLVAGRSFTLDESFATAGSADPIVINETLALRLFGTREAVGRIVRLAPTRMKAARDLSVIGVARDAHWNNITGSPEPFVYFPFGGYVRMGRGTFLVRSSLPISEVGEVAGAIAARTDSRVPFDRARPLTADIDRQLADERLFAWVLSLLAALGFLLASLGLYGLVAQTVAERAREFGIRVALGANHRHIGGMVARFAMLVSAAGIAMGLVLSLAGTHMLENMLHGVTRLDPRVYLAAALALVTAVALACIAPVVRALSVQPVDVLRGD